MLITLGIIGIVAEMTIPTLIHDVGENSLKIKWKKEFSSITQAVQMITNENGGHFAYSLGSDQNSAITIFKNYLKIIKTCTAGADVTTDNGGCWANPVYYTKGSIASTTTPGYGMTLADGTLITLWNSSNCNDTNALFTPGSIMPRSPADYICVSMLIDVNGFKKPNTYGQDIFGLLIYPSSIVKPYSSATFQGLKDSAAVLIE